MTVLDLPPRRNDVESSHHFRRNVLIFFASALPMIVIPYIHIGVIYRLIWVPDKPKIDREKCKCGCFDTIFKGSYEKPGDVGYKHMYFNTTWQMYNIWVMTVFFLLATYESTKYLLQLALKRRLRGTMLFLFVTNIYPNYYAWWNFFSYYNDDFYSYFRHDFYFMVTELITTLTVLRLCDVRREIAPWQLLVIISISTMHLLLGGMDQFVVQLLFGEGGSYLKVRNLGFMLPDICHIAVASIEIVRHARKMNERLRDIFSRNHITLSVCFIAFGTVFGRFLW